MFSLFDFIILVILIFANAFFVVSEFTLLRLPKTRLSSITEDGGYGASYLTKIMENLNLHITSLQIGITSSTILFGLVGYRFFTKLINNGFMLLSLSLNSNFVFYTGLGLTFLILIGIYSILGEIAPKILSIKKIDVVARYIAPTTYIFTIIISPFTNSFRWISFKIFRFLRLKPEKIVYKQVYSEDELKLIIATSKEEGEIDATEHELIQKVLSFTDKLVKEILTPRYKIVAFNLNTDMDAILSKASDTGHSRFPVYKTKLDEILGFIHIKDVITAKISRADFNLNLVLRNVVTIHEGMVLDVLLRKMQNERSHVAIVVDEFGSVEGLVTIEDIIEEIFGEIDDEFDHLDSQLIENLTAEKIIVDGDITLDDFNNAFETNLEASDSLTLAGYILEQNESLPSEGSEIIIGDCKYTIMKMDGNRIAKVEVLKKGKELIESNTKDNPP